MVSYYIGDSCICWSLGKEITRDINSRVLYLYRELESSDLTSDLGVLDIVPSYNAVAVYFSSLSDNPDKARNSITDFFNNRLENFSPSQAGNGRLVTLPVVYNGMDLERVAELNSISVEDVINIHSNGNYQVAMIGFKPYFPYLIGLDPKLETPRLDSPRLSIPAGSVAIGGAQTGVYPVNSPGGWNILGETDPELLKSLKPGDIVKMERVNSVN